MTIKLITDGSVDLPEPLIARYEIDVVPPLVMLDGQSYRSNVDITREEFFALLTRTDALPMTSQPSPGQFLEAFGRALDAHEKVLYIGISSRLSGTFNSAIQAAQEFPEGAITLVDSLGISAAGGFQVLAAARALAAGEDLAGAVAAAARIREQTTLMFSVDDLTYLIKGGRVGRMAGALGSLLSIKPVIQLDRDEGVLIPTDRVRTFRGAMRRMLDHVSAAIGPGGRGRFMMLAADMQDENARFERALRERFDPDWFEIVIPSPTLIAHTGPRGLGVVVAAGDWEHD